MRIKTLKFIVDGEDKGESYSRIPTDKPLVPVVFLYHKNDSVEIIDYQINKYLNFELNLQQAKIQYNIILIFILIYEKNNIKDVEY